MKIFTSLQLLFCLITLALALPRHARDSDVVEKQENLQSESKLENNLPKLEEPKEKLQDKDLNTEATNSNSDESKNPKQFNYASLQSQIIAANILKDNIENRGNEVFSPLGISTILAILAEASQGDTYKEFENALGYPNDKTLLRESFKDILQAYKKNDYDINPSFKTWFYIYRNNTAKDNFKDIIRNYYTAEVKEIDNNDFDWDEPKTSSDANDMKKNEVHQNTNLKSGATTSSISPSAAGNEEKPPFEEQSDKDNKDNSKDIIGFEDLKKSDFVDEKLPEVIESEIISLPASSSSSTTASSDSKIPIEIEKLFQKVDNSNDGDMILIKETNRMNDLNEIEEIIEIEKEASKFDAIVDDKQYVEVPVIKAEIAKEIEEKRKREEKETAATLTGEKSEMKEESPLLVSSMTLVETNSKDSENLKETNESDNNDIKLSSQSLTEDESKNIVDAVLKEIKAEKVALDDYIKETSNKEIKSEITETEAAAIEELNKEEKLIESVILLKEPDAKDTTILPIEVPLQNSDNNQIRRVDLVDINDEENETISQEEKIDNLRKHNRDPNNDKDTETVVFVESKEPEKITLTIKKLDDENGEIMEAVETSFTKRKIEPRSLLQKDDIASALSANSISGRENPSKTKMLLFNGLYYRGNWAHPFMELRCDSMDTFTTTDGRSVSTRMMKTRGSFRMAKLESLDADALELPYENERFSFILIVPKHKDGLERLIEKLQPVDLQMLQTRLTDTITTINLPKFEIEQTSRSEKTMKRLGINKIFSAYTSNMGDLSDEPGLHVDEVVQHVNLRVDEGAASSNALSASNSLGRAIEKNNKEDDDEKHFDVNRPFLYFVMDRSNNFIIVAGKLIEPQIKEEFGFESKK